MRSACDKCDKILWNGEMYRVSVMVPVREEYTSHRRESNYLICQDCNIKLTKWLNKFDIMYQDVMKKEKKLGKMVK